MASASVMLPLKSMCDNARVLPSGADCSAIRRVVQIAGVAVVVLIMFTPVG